MQMLSPASGAKQAVLEPRLGRGTVFDTLRRGYLLVLWPRGKGLCARRAKAVIWPLEHGAPTGSVALAAFRGLHLRRKGDTEPIRALFEHIVRLLVSAVR